MNARPRGRFRGRRVSWLRVAASTLAGLALVAAGVAAVAPPISLPPVGTPMDQRWYAGYYDVTLDQGTELADDELATAPGGAVLAFVVAADDTDCTPTWGRPTRSTTRRRDSIWIAGSNGCVAKATR
jgi:chitinase